MAVIFFLLFNLFAYNMSCISYQDVITILANIYRPDRSSSSTINKPDIQFMMRVGTSINCRYFFSRTYLKKSLPNFNAKKLSRKTTNFERNSWSYLWSRCSFGMPVPSQGHYGFHSFPVVDWFCLFI